MACACSGSCKDTIKSLQEENKKLKKENIELNEKLKNYANEIASFEK